MIATLTEVVVITSEVITAFGIVTVVLYMRSVEQSVKRVGGGVSQATRDIADVKAEVVTGNQSTMGELAMAAEGRRSQAIAPSDRIGHEQQHAEEQTDRDRTDAGPTADE